MPVAVAEFGEDLVVDRVEFLGELLQFLLAETGERTFPRWRSWRSLQSQFDLHVALGGVDADADVLAGRLRDVSGAQVAHPARLQRSDAGVTDADPASEGQVEAGLFAGVQDGRAAVGVDGLSLSRNSIWPPSPSPGLPPIFGWKRS